jgi:S-DNA-T family DNA segregation ATPase FtsK/SpoIIIE
VLADLGVQSLGLAAGVAALMLVVLGLSRAAAADPDACRLHLRLRAAAGLGGVIALAGMLAAPSPPAAWPLARGLGGFWGDAVLHALAPVFAFAHLPAPAVLAALFLAPFAALGVGFGLGLSRAELRGFADWTLQRLQSKPQVAPPPENSARAARVAKRKQAETVAEAPGAAAEPLAPAVEREGGERGAADREGAGPKLKVKPPKSPPKESSREQREAQATFEFAKPASGFVLPELGMLAKPKPRAAAFDEGALRQNARLLENVLAEFGVRGQVDQIRPGPVVTLYELAPAAGVKSARVVALSDDIARSMSVAACRVSVVQGRNAIGIELPNQSRETVYLRDLLASPEYERGGQVLPMALGETIGGRATSPTSPRCPTC